jgi:hypothetical protein
MKGSCVKRVCQQNLVGLGIADMGAVIHILQSLLFNKRIAILVETINIFVSMCFFMFSVLHTQVKDFSLIKERQII